MIAKPVANFVQFFASGAPGNDNHPASRGAAPARRLHRPMLVRRWFVTPSGALECHWSTAAAGDGGDDPVQSRRSAAASLRQHPSPEAIVTLEHMARRSISCIM